MDTRLAPSQLCSEFSHYHLQPSQHQPTTKPPITIRKNADTDIRSQVMRYASRQTSYESVYSFIPLQRPATFSESLIITILVIECQDSQLTNPNSTERRKRTTKTGSQSRLVASLQQDFHWGPKWAPTTTNYLVTKTHVRVLGRVLSRFAAKKPSQDGSPARLLAFQVSRKLMYTSLATTYMKTSFPDVMIPMMQVCKKLLFLL